MASIARPPHGIQETVKALLREKNPTPTDEGGEHPQTPPLARNSELSDSHHDHNEPSTSQASWTRSPRPSSQSRRWSVNTPSARTGPPRSISHNYSIAGSHPASRENSSDGHGHDGRPHIRLPTPTSEEWEDTDQVNEFAPMNTPFRGALEYSDPDQREKERELVERRNRRRESFSYFHDVFHPSKRITDSPKENQSPFPDPRRDSRHQGEETTSPGPSSPTVPTSPDLASSPEARHGRGMSLTSTPATAATSPRLSEAGRTRSLPHFRQEGKPNGALKWNRLRSFLPSLAQQGRDTAPGPSVVVPQSVNITDELLAGGLSALLLRLHFERDEKGHRRVPILFQRLRIRVSDSLHPLHGHKAVFRIECEYANGAARWVVYRQLREFLSLHGHYTLSNAYNRNVETLPDFPRAGLPYFNFLKERGNDFTRADFARLQREALENYLIGLMRAVMFHPSSNRLAAFLEISALSIALAQSGGAQYKAGFLRIEAVTNKGPFGKRGTGWKEKKMQRWCAVRESYLVVVEEMGELTVHDVFMIDSDFKIERPKRYYRQGLNLLAHPEVALEDEKADKSEKHEVASISGRSIRSRISNILHVGHRRGASGGSSLKAPKPTSVRGERQASPDGSDDENEGTQLARQITPILDPSTNTNPLLGPDEHNDKNPSADKDKKKQHGDVSKHTFYVENSQMRLKLYARNERQMLQWIAAMERVARESHYTGKNRFDSFAPIRLNVAAQWLVDGRDYFWNLSRAILLAKESIYIHDWWLSPELQLRRPRLDKYRLDNLLERKAKEGVKIYVILYQEVSSRTTPTDSNYAKQRLSSLHPNIMVQRSPSHFQTGTFYWAHHEKLCVIDQAIAFMGGLDACFGRWDTPQHVLVDDPETGDPADHIWTGKDYSNPRVTDFHALNKPFEDMYDRTKVPRMPWHDVSMQIVGQPARDLARHFVQRWNYLLRIKNHTRPMPSLLPPPEFRPGELNTLGLTGTCELQICRSAGVWSLGTPDRIELSIQNAYLKAIQMSEHFIYIENQFFITSTVVNEVKIENKIGDALVHRIIRAHKEGTPFKVCIVIPLLPGFTFPVDHSDASAIRIILECQNRTICRGPNSIFARLRKEGIDPDDYISFFSLRNWGKLRGDVLTTEQVYIHAKVMIVDDRLAIIGSANINERSMRGDRDSEIASVIRDTDMVECTMAGKPYKVGRFAHTLRIRLMREHLGVDVDAMYEEDLMASSPVKQPHEIEEWDPDVEQEYGREHGVTHVGKGQRRTAKMSLFHDTVDAVEQAVHGTGDVEAKDTAMLLRKTGLKTKGLDATASDKTLEQERQTFTREGEKEHGFTSSVVPTLEEKLITEQLQNDEAAKKTEQNGAGDANSKPGKHTHKVSFSSTVSQGSVSQNGDAKPAGNGEAKRRKGPGANGALQLDLQNGHAEAHADNELYGAPANSDPKRDDSVPGTRADGTDTEEEEKAPSARSTIRKHLSAKLSASKQWTLPTPAPHVDPHGFEDPISDVFWKKTWLASAVHNTEIFRKVFHAVPDDLITTWKQYKEFIVHHERLNKPARDQPGSEPVARVPSEVADSGAPGAHSADAVNVHEESGTTKSKDFADSSTSTTTPTTAEPPAQDKADKGDKGDKGARTRKTSRSPEPFDQAEREEMERLLGELRGHLVLYPTRFLEGEDIANNFLFNADRLLPLPIYD
ncbi:phospholipase D1 [Phanerochaete sordida]|uniref:Phospholipase n=1 Tax=Phanerochaete sordida TaxID=48140 RepID=A0A9P3LAN0_9APHY|nr:phospholipase D1 [Phanerochaete sordida]